MKTLMNRIMPAMVVATTLGFGATTAGAETVLRFASSQAPEGGYMGEVVKVLGDAIAEKTNGEVTVKAFYSGSLSSNERELAEMVQTGAVDMANAATTNILGWTPSAKVFDLPYLFEGIDHYKAVVQGEVGDFVKTDAESGGVKIITYILPGIRSIFNNERPIETLEDAKGLKIRSMESPVYVEMFERMGMLPTPLPASELYTGLQLGTVDAGENDPASVVSWGWKDVITYYSLNQHSIAVVVIMMNKSKFDSLSPDVQEAILEAGREAEDYQIGYIADAWERSLEEIRAAGVQVNEIEDITPFQEAVAPMVGKYAEEIGHGLVQKVQEAAQ